MAGGFIRRIEMKNKKIKEKRNKAKENLKIREKLIRSAAHRLIVGVDINYTYKYEGNGKKYPNKKDYNRIVLLEKCINLEIGADLQSAIYRKPLRLKELLELEYEVLELMEMRHLIDFKYFISAYDIELKFFEDGSVDIMKTEFGELPFELPKKEINIELDSTLLFDDPDLLVDEDFYVGRLNRTQPITNGSDFEEIDDIVFFEQ